MTETSKTVGVAMPREVEQLQGKPCRSCGNLLPLDNFGTIPFSHGSAVRDGQVVTIAGADARAITMLSDADQALAVPSSLSDDGTGPKSRAGGTTLIEGLIL